MNQLLAMIRKELILWAKKPGQWIIVFLVPVLFIWIIQAVFGSSGTPTVTVYAVNEDAGSLGGRVMDALDDAEALAIEELETGAEAHELVGSGARMAAVLIPESFSKDVTTDQGGVVVIIVDPARAEQANIVVGLVNAALAPIIVDAEVSRGVEDGINRVMLEYQAEPTPEGTPGIDEPLFPEETPFQEETPDFDLTPFDEETPFFEETPFGEVTPEAETTPAPGEETEAERLRRFFSAALTGIVSSQVQEAVDDPQVKLAVQPVEADPNQPVHRPSLLDSLVPGYSLMFVFFLIPNLALSVIEERETGTMRRLLLAPVPRSRILLGKMLPYFLIGVLQFVAVMMVSQVLFRIDLGSPLALFVMMVASALAMAALSVMIAAFARTAGQADGLAVVLVLAMAVVSGAMFPSISIPGVQMATPHYWALQGFLNVIARGSNVEGVLLPAGILVTMAAVFFTIGAIRFRFE